MKPNFVPSPIGSVHRSQTEINGAQAPKNGRFGRPGPDGRGSMIPRIYGTNFRPSDKLDTWPGNRVRQRPAVPTCRETEPRRATRIDILIGSAQLGNVGAKPPHRRHDRRTAYLEIRHQTSGHQRHAVFRVSAARRLIHVLELFRGESEREPPRCRDAER